VPHVCVRNKPKEVITMSDILTSINTRVTPQSKPSRPDQVKNAAGGYVFQVGDKERLHRFLTLGTDSNSYYTKAAELTRQNADVVFRMAATDPETLIGEILAISEAGRAPKNKFAIFALAIAASAEEATTRQYALDVMHKVCRTSTHLFEFNTYLDQFRGWGRARMTAVADWYLKKPVDKLAYQAVKYRGTRGSTYSHRNLMRKVKPGRFGAVKSPEREALFDFITKGTRPALNLGPVDDAHAFEAPGLAIVADYLDAKAATTVAQWVEIIGRGHGVSWEMLPDEALRKGEVWEALIHAGMPHTALIRSLGRITSVLGASGSWIAPVATQLQDTKRLIKGRVHPINVLIAMRTYASGKGERGKLTWPVARQIVDALDAGFYNSYGSVESSGKRRLIALDISGSMTQVRWGQPNLIAGLPITPREASSAIALVTLAAEPNTEIIGFSGTGRAWAGYSMGSRGQRVMFNNTGMGEPIRLDISPRRRLDDVCAYTYDLPYGDTDCALPFTWALGQGLDFDSVEIYTDNESWSGPIHAHQAAERYRNYVGHDVKFIAVAMTATDYSVVDSKDASGMNVSGFDAAVPNLISDFVADRL
jgi:60 kDa SS-A/Ro ribonucleoprotein